MMAGGSRYVLRNADDIEATYDVHEYVDEKREALERWTKYLAELRDGQPVNPKKGLRQIGLGKTVDQA
jgi:hypothetical protein